MAILVKALDSHMANNGLRSEHGSLKILLDDCVCNAQNPEKNGKGIVGWISPGGGRDDFSLSLSTAAQASYGKKSLKQTKKLCLDFKTVYTEITLYFNLKTSHINIPILQIRKRPK